MHKADCVLLHACFWWEKDYQPTFRALLADVSLIIIGTRGKKKGWIQYFPLSFSYCIHPFISLTISARIDWLKTLTCRKAEILSHMLPARLYLFDCDKKNLFLLKIQDLALSFKPGVLWYVFFSRIFIVWNVFVLLIYQAPLLTPHLPFSHCVCTSYCFSFH